MPLNWCFVVKYGSKILSIIEESTPPALSLILITRLSSICFITTIISFSEFLFAKASLALIKIFSWEGTEQFEQLMPERILMSASLVLKDEAKESIQKIKERLGGR